MYTLLIADDERLECDAIELLVNRAKLPLQCIKAKNGREAVSLATQYQPDIAFLDIKMPGMDGIEAAKHIREIAPDCQIIFLTAWSSFEFAQQAIRLGASEYLVKPVQRKEVYDLLDSLLAQLDERKLAREQHSGDILEVLNLFSREFFAALKFGELPIESLKSYFAMQGISSEQGVALVIGGMEEKAIKLFFQDNQRLPKLQLCYFPAIDRITVLVFTNQPSKIVEQLAGFQSLAYSNIGSGMFFSDLAGIPQAISTASISYSHAYRLHVRFQRFSDILKIPKDSVTLQKKTDEMLQDTLQGELGKAREIAHEIIDMVNTTNDNPTLALNELYELLVVFCYELNKSVPFLQLGKPEKRPVMEQEIYLMDLLDSTCQAVLEDKQDRYSRAFRLVDQYLHSHYPMQISVEMASKMINLNPKYFSQLFKVYLGSPFVEYLTRIRMEKAKQLLDEGDRNVKEIAEMTGFLDGNYFTRVFRQYYGMAPSIYMEEQENTKF
ncbi:response regulator [uncultured Sphaerochaeta sp.]|uniref:response regulator transcription factor n=1 Tax=uncultured Sphaerochaeta sp. TaxID=886478 RepID=UPI002A0A34F8|nr:response regulator [uncultured Sphaerochaeta sp.]